MKRPTRNQHGVALVMVSLFMVALLTAVGLVAQLGMLYQQRTRMQVAADAAALAGAQLIPQGTSAAVSEAQTYAADNGFAIASNAVSVGTDSVTVGWAQPVDMIMPSLLPLAGDEVAVSSQATLQVINQDQGSRPWGIPQSNFVAGAEYVLKQAAGCSSRGNFQALAIDGNGASIYRQSIIEGSRTTLHVGDTIATEPGDIVGPTIDAVNQLIGNDETSFQDAIAHPDQTPRIVTVPLLTDASWNAANGKSGVVVAGFARFYLTYTTSMGEVYGRFVDQVSEDAAQGSVTHDVVKLVG